MPGIEAGWRDSLCLLEVKFSKGRLRTEVKSLLNCAIDSSERSQFVLELTLFTEKVTSSLSEVEVNSDGSVSLVWYSEKRPEPPEFGDDVTEVKVKVNREEDAAGFLLMPVIIVLVFLIFALVWFYNYSIEQRFSYVAKKQRYEYNTKVFTMHVKIL